MLRRLFPCMFLMGPSSNLQRTQGLLGLSYSTTIFHAVCLYNCNTFECKWFFWHMHVSKSDVVLCLLNPSSWSGEWLGWRQGWSSWKRCRARPKGKRQRKRGCRWVAVILFSWTGWWRKCIEGGFLFLPKQLPFFLVTKVVKLRNWSTLLLSPQEYLDGEEADFRRRAWGKRTPALPKTRGPFVPLLPVAMVTREQDPSLLFSVNPKEGGHTSANGMEQRGPNISLQRVHAV